MSINAIGSGSAYTYTGAAKASSAKTNTAKNETTTTEAAAVYEASSGTDTASGKTTKVNDALIKQLKADSDNKVNQMRSLVESMFKKQGIQIGTADDMWKILASGEFTADADTIAQAKADIAEDGYWGVTQTSDRIFDFAMALSGGDETKMQTMMDAVKKGFSEATKSWGKKLPDISSQTYDAVMKKFDSYFNKDSESDTTTAETEA